MLLLFSKRSAQFLLGVLATFVLSSAHAGLFDDEEARKAILELRNRVEQNRQAAEAQSTDLKRQLALQDKALQEANEGNAVLRRSVLDLQNLIEALRGELAKLRGQDEQLARDVAEMQRRQKDLAQGIDERVRKFEPVKVSIDGREFMAEPVEKREFEAAFALFRKPDYPAAATALSEFVKRYPQSGYGPSALFWLGNAEFATRDYRDALVHFRALLAQAPDHVKAPEAALAMANSQIELKDTRGARKTLEDLIKDYPQSEAAGAAKERLARLR
jgi:tol-pal system protein YbgF